MYYRSGMLLKRTSYESHRPSYKKQVEIMYVLCLNNNKANVEMIVANMDKIAV